MKLLARAKGHYIAEISDAEIAAIHGEEQLGHLTWFDAHGNRFQAEAGIVGAEIDLVGMLKAMTELEATRKQYPLHAGNALRELATAVDKAVDALGPKYPWVKRDAD